MDDKNVPPSGTVNEESESPDESSLDSTGAPITQEKEGFREGMPPWIKQLPRLSFPQKANPTFRIIRQNSDLETMESLKNLPEAKKAAYRKTTLEHEIEQAKNDPYMLGSKKFTADAIDAARKQVEDDIDWLKKELEPHFRERDHQASREQNRYRIYQLGFMLLAAAATLFGSLQALTFESSPNATTAWGFVETVIALYTVFLATISGRRPPLSRWLENRQKAEYLRREYFRFLMNLPPYNSKSTSSERKIALSIRTGEINEGKFSSQQNGGTS